MSVGRWAAWFFGAIWLAGAWGCASHQTVVTSPVVVIPPVVVNPELIVAADGSGQFTSVQAAIDSIQLGATGPVSIHVKPGIYTEAIVISRDKPAIRIWGDDAAGTVLTFNRQANALGPDGRKLGTFRTASVVVEANDFEADQITFANSTPRDISQALAISCLGDRQIYRKCRFLGWQDTIYTNGGPPPSAMPMEIRHNATMPAIVLSFVATTEPAARASFMPTTAPTTENTAGENPAATEPISLVPAANRLYFEDCYVEGGVDFIFGNSTAVFNRCEIHSKRHGYLTAASTSRGVAYGYVFMNCKLTVAPDVKDGSVYLGRPWREYANVIYLNCWMGKHISPAGWSIWKSAPNRIATVHYYEYGSTGPGGATDKRVKWSHQLTSAQAAAITVDAVLGGDDQWNPGPLP